MTTTNYSAETMQRDPGTTASFLQRLFSWRMLRRGIFVAVCLATLIALFYAVENWRGKRAWEKCRRELEAKGEVIDWSAFIPAPVPDDQNIYKAPHMTEWFVKRSLPAAVSPGSAKPGDAGQPFSVLPRRNAETGPITVAEVQIVSSKEPLPPGKADAVLRFDDPAAPEQAARLIRARLGPCVEGARGCVIAARSLAQLRPVYLVVQADKVPTAKAIAEFLPRSPVPHTFYGPNEMAYFKVETAGSNGMLLSLKPDIYTASEYLELSQPAVPDLDVLRQAVERPRARMDGDYQRPYDHPVPNFVGFRSVAQMLSQRAQCYLLLGQPEAAWHELSLVRGMSRLLEAKPASDAPTLVQAMIDVAVGGLYVSIIQDGLRLQAWREPELAAIQQQLAEVNFLPLVSRAFHAERAATCRTFESTPPAELRKLFAIGQGNRGWWSKLKEPTYVYLAFGPRGWLYQNMTTGAPAEQSLLDTFDVANDQVLPSRLDHFVAEASLHHFSPYGYLWAIAVPNFMKAVQTVARNQTLANEAFIACGLERYRLAQQKYPANLNALVPQFAPKLPHDLIGGGPLKYERASDNHFELYSIGWNAKDDGGVAGKTIAEGDWVW